MSLRVNLKLKLSKTVKRIIVKYNTFEKATYDEYLIASLVLHSKSWEDAYEYIDDITGAGSLNPHFKKLYKKISSFSEEQLNRIIDSSNFPVLKIDDKTIYDYYPQLNISVLNKRVYEGDISETEDLSRLLYISEEIIESRIKDEKTLNKPEPYSVEFGNDGTVAVEISDKKVNMESDLFETLLDSDLHSVSDYRGTVHDFADGNDWRILNNSVINNLFSNANYFYDDSGNHIQIRNDNVRCTEVARMHGLYIYRESIIGYDNNRQICSRALETINQNYAFSVFKPQTMVKLLRNVERNIAVAYINAYSNNVSMQKEIAVLAVELIASGHLASWDKSTLKSVIKFCNKREYSLIYKADPDLGFKIDQLILIDKKLLTDKHKKQVEAYYNNLNQKKATIKEITGEITVRGLREKVKDLPSDKQTKRFSKLCNALIGHVNKDLDSVGLSETDQWLNDALELKELGIELRRRLDTLK